MKKLRQLIPLFLGASLVAFPLLAAEIDQSATKPQQHGTTMMHSSPSDEEDMSHTMHGSQAGDAATKKAPHSTGDHHADHDMEPKSRDMGEHAHHAKPGTKTTVSSSESLQKLKQLPSSGKSREANYDGTYFMHNTSMEQSLEARCALASRGLMMLDNASWKKCGGKPIGWSKGITSAQTDSDHSNHMNH